MLAVPLNRTPQAGPQIDGGRPAGQLAQLGRVEELVEDLPRRQPGAVLRLDLSPAHLGGQVDHLAYRVGPVAACVEGLAGGAPAVERGGDREVGRDRVVDVEEVAPGRAV